MDRIRRALDLARLERAHPEPARRADHGAAGAGAPAAAKAAAKAAAEPTDSAPLTSIVYTRTKSFTPSGEHLERNRILNPSGTGSAAAEHTDSAPLTSIVYTRTKSFTPSGEHLERNRILNPSGTGSAAAAYRMLRTQVLQRMDAHAWRSLAIFSPSAEDGKTTTAINLAASVASDHAHTVLLVGFDFKRPTLASSFGLTAEFGVDDALTERAALEECLHHPEGFERLVLLPARAGLANSSEVLSGPH